MTEFDTQLKQFEPISLSEMESVKLLDRLDTKFTFRRDQLAEVLAGMRPHYRLLEINGNRAHRYETLYFDTESLTLYAMHHGGKFKRYKVRFRNYLDSALCFFEVKAKSNKGRTVKQRIARETIPRAIEGAAAGLLQQATPLAAQDCKPTIWVYFTRLTFVAKSFCERLTIDLGLSFKNETAAVSLPQLVIAEVKQDKSAAVSPFIQLMRGKRIWEGSMSKYCFGIVNLYPQVKMNRFKERLKQLQTLAQ